MNKVYLENAEVKLLSLRANLNAAASSWEIYKFLRSKKTKDDSIFNSLREFFNSTMSAHLHFSTLTLAKFFETDSDVFSIYSIKDVNSKITKRKHTTNEKKL